MSNEVAKTGTDTNEKIVHLVQNKRKLIAGIAGCIILAVAGLITVLSVAEFLRKRAIGIVEGLNSRYEALRFNINDESKKEEVDLLLEDIDKFARKNGGLAGARGWALIASIRMDKKEWNEAEEAWNNAAKAAVKTYFEPIALFQAGRAAEERGDIAGAVGYFTRSASFSFPAAARAQFSVARLEEGRNNIEAAIEAYRVVTDKFSTYVTWANMAQSRIILLQSRK
jgi:tetratricopeptide (TPR) repeat protein